MKTVKLISALCITLPICALAANTTAAKTTFSGSPTAVLEKISSQISQGNTTAQGADKSNNANAQSLIKDWQQYFKLDTDRNSAASDIQSNSGFASITANLSSVYGNTANQASGTSADTLAKTPIQILCSQTDADENFCQNASNGDAGSNFSNTNSAGIMTYGSGTQTTSVSSTYIQNVVNGAIADPQNVSSQNTLSGATALQNSLSMIQKAYTQPPAKTTTTNGKTTTTQASSQMQSIHQAVLAPFTTTYTKSLSTASSTQALRAIAQLLAENNLINYQKLKLAQSQAVVQDNQLAAQMQANKIAKQNQTLLASVAKALKDQSQK